MKALLDELLHEEQSEIVVVFWGTNALEIYQYLNRHTLFIGHHPTYRIQNEYLPFKPYEDRDGYEKQARRQFRYMHIKWPNLFTLERLGNDGT